MRPYPPTTKSPVAIEPVKVCAKFADVDVKLNGELGSTITPPILRGTAEAGAAMAIEIAAPVANKAFLKLVILNPPNNIYQFELGSNIVIEANIVPILKEFFILLKLIKDFDKNLLKWLVQKC